MKVAYLTLFGFSENTGRHARMNDIFDAFEKHELTFDYRVFSLISNSKELALASFGFEKGDIWGSRWHNIEAVLAGRRTLGQILQYDPDILHVTGTSPSEVVLTRVISNKIEVPVILGPQIGGWYPVRRSEFWPNGFSGNLINKYNKIWKTIALRVNNPNRVLVFSEYHKLMMRSIWNRSDRISIMPPAVRDDFHNKQLTRDIDILYVGDFTNQKGYNVLINALNNIDGKITAKVKFIGDKPDCDHSFKTIDCDFRGFVPRSDLPKYYNRAKLFICLSSDEMGPNTLIEALSCGTPALVNNEIGMREYLRNGNGILCERNKVEDVTAKITYCLDNQRTLLKSAAEAAPEYKIEDAITWLSQVYKDIS